MKLPNRLFFVNCLVIVFLAIPFFSKAQDLDPAKWPHLKGYWKFQDSANLTKATVGSDLILVGTHSRVKGPSYGDTAVRVPLGSYYKCYHGIAPNGGGSKVNRYTLMIDFKVLNFNRWHTFFQTDTSNANDGECFIKPNNQTIPGTIGTAATKYTPDAIVPEKWYRLIISVNSTNYHRYYLNGNLVLEGNPQASDDRFALSSLALFFADDNQEDDTMDVASVALFDTCLSAQEIADIGTIDPCVRYPVLVNIGSDTSMCTYSAVGRGLSRSYASHLWSTGDTNYYTVLKYPPLKLGQNLVWLRATDVNGCTATDTFMLNYLAPPSLSLGADRKLCQGQSTSLVAGSNAANKYSWFDLPSSTSFSSQMSLNIDSSGTYAVTVQNVFGCESRDTIGVSVFANPGKPAIKVTGKTSLCTGDSVLLEAPALYASYTWNNGVKAAAQYTSKSGVFKVMVKDTNTCESPWSDSVVVNAYTTPAKAGVNVLGKTNFCAGDSVQIVAKVTSPGYVWSNGDSVKQITVKASAQITLRYKSNGCEGPPSDPVSVSVFPAPARPVIVKSGPTEFCNGDSVVLSIKSGYTQYFWQDFFNRYERVQKTGGKFFVYVRDSNNCVSPVSDTVDIVVNPTPAKPMIKGDAAICPGDSAHLIADSGFAAYSWSNGYTGDRQVVADTGTYTVFGTTVKGCASPMSDPLKVIHLAKPAKPVIAKSGTDSLKTSGGQKYLWFEDGTPRADSVSSIKPLSGSYYRVAVWNGNCWSDQSDSFLFTAGIFEKDFSGKNISVYPNPAGERIVLKSTVVTGESITWSIFSVDGKLLNGGTCNAADLASGLTVDLSIFSEGMYIIVLKSAEATYFKKFQKL